MPECFAMMKLRFQITIWLVLYSSCCFLWNEHLSMWLSESVHWCTNNYDDQSCRRFSDRWFPVIEGVLMWPPKMLTLSFAVLLWRTDQRVSIFLIEMFCKMLKYSLFNLYPPYLVSSYRSPLWKMRWEVCDLWLVRAAVHPRANLRRM